MSGFMKGILAGLGAVAMLFAGLFSGDASAASYSISQGDLLSIYVYRQEDMNVKVRVDNSGYIRFPIAGRINVIGKTPDQIESVIATALRRNGFESPKWWYPWKPLLPARFLCWVKSMPAPISPVRSPKAAR